MLYIFYHTYFKECTIRLWSEILTFGPESHSGPLMVLTVEISLPNSQTTLLATTQHSLPLLTLSVDFCTRHSKRVEIQTGPFERYCFTSSIRRINNEGPEFLYVCICACICVCVCNLIMYFGELAILKGGRNHDLIFKTQSALLIDNHRKP